MKHFDEERIRDAEYLISKYEEEAGGQQRLKKRNQEEDCNELPTYDPGMY